MKKRALIIVDMQNDFCPKGALPVKDGDKIIPVINSLMEKFSDIVATKDWHPENSEHFKKWPVHCVAKTYGAEFHPELKTDKIDKIFFKGTDNRDDGYSGFEATNESLESYLRAREITDVYICGLALDYCVKSTALDAVSKGFNTFIVLDATKAVADDENEIIKLISDLKRDGIKLITSKEIL